MSRDALPEPLCRKRDRLIERLQALGSCAVAFSGGLDSAVLAQAAVVALADRAVAFTATSPSMAQGELDEAVVLARRMGIRHEILPTDELSDPAYQVNSPERCYVCKTHLLGAIRAAAVRRGLAAVVEGTCRDDASDYRPGRRAVDEQGVLSPLAECDLAKDELRELARAWDLPVWDKPSTPCLSSRVAYGEPITPERLRQIDQAEAWLRERGFRTLRVRYHRGDVARIEVPVESLDRFADAAFCREVVAALKSLGFRYVALDLEGFRSGSLNEVLAAIQSDETEEGSRKGAKTQSG